MNAASADARSGNDERDRKRDGGDGRHGDQPLQLVALHLVRPAVADDDREHRRDDTRRSTTTTRRLSSSADQRRQRRHRERVRRPPARRAGPGRARWATRLRDERRHGDDDDPPPAARQQAPVGEDQRDPDQDDDDRHEEAEVVDDRGDREHAPTGRRRAARRRPPSVPIAMVVASRAPAPRISGPIGLPGTRAASSAPTKTNAHDDRREHARPDDVRVAGRIERGWRGRTRRARPAATTHGHRRDAPGVRGPARRTSRTWWSPVVRARAHHRRPSSRNRYDRCRVPVIADGSPGPRAGRASGAAPWRR